MSLLLQTKKSSSETRRVLKRKEIEGKMAFKKSI